MGPLIDEVVRWKEDILSILCHTGPPIEPANIVYNFNLYSFYHYYLIHLYNTYIPTYSYVFIHF
jgi:hypothetical protein